MPLTADRHHRVEDESQAAHDQLEIRVEERTRELLASVDDLHQEVLAREKAQQDLTAEKERLAVTLRGIAHDFNNILSAILGNIEMAAMLSDESAKEPRALLAEAKKAALRAKELTGQLLTLAKGGEPVKRVAPVAETVAPVNEQPRRTGKVLVMDDEEMVRELVQGMLTHLGYQSAMTTDGGEALAKYREAMAANTPFDAVIMDLTVPGGMGGKEAAVKLRALDPKARIIVASGYSHDPIMAHPAEYGFDATLNKPFELAELAAILKETV